MFKVDASLKSSKPTRVLRKSDRRKLLESIVTSLRNDAHLVDAALADAADVELRPLADCTLVAAVRGDAHFVDLNSNKFMPTLVTALLAPVAAALPVFETHAAVFLQHLSHGADFMLPGCHLADRMESIEPSWSVGDVVVIAVRGTPVALGTALMSRAEAAAAARKGKLVRVLHYYGDALWLASSRRGNDAVVAALTGANNDPNDNDNDNDATDVAVESTTVTSTADTVAVVSPDDILQQSFLRGCCAVRDDELPMLVSTFFERMLTNRPVGSTVDLKASKHKKLLPFLQAMAASAGAINLDEQSAGVWRVTWIDRDSDAYRDAATAAVATSDAAAPAPASVFASNGVLDVEFGRERASVALPAVLAELATAKHPRLVELLSVDESLAALFGADERLLDVARAPQVVGNVMRQNTTSVGKNTCTLNASLGAVFDDVAADATLTKKAVTERINRLLHPCWIVVQPDGTPSRVHKGAPPHVTIHECMVRGHKCTAVMGLQALLGVPPSAVCDDWRQQLAAGCAEGEHHSQVSVIVQGLLSAQIVAILERDFRLPATVLTVRQLKGKR